MPIACSNFGRRRSSWASTAETFLIGPELQRLLASVRGKPQEYAIKLGLLKSLKRARYAPEPLGHYGLHKSNYTHFTSPIRRYSDLVVHRALGHLLGLTKRAADSSVLGSIADHISTTERIAADAEKDSVKLKKLEFFQNQLSSRRWRRRLFGAHLGSAQLRTAHRVAGLSLMNGLVHVSALDGDFFLLDAAHSRLVGRRSRRVFRLATKSAFKSPEWTFSSSKWTFGRCELPENFAESLKN